MGSLAVAQNKPANGSFASLLEKLTGVSNDDCNTSTSSGEDGFASQSSDTGLLQSDSGTAATKRSIAKKPAIVRSGAANPLARELSYENALRRHARHPLPESKPSKGPLNSRGDSTIETEFPFDSDVSHPRELQNEFPDESRTVQTPIGTSALHPPRVKAARSMPVSTREDKGFAAGGLRAATESFPPIAPVLISAETLHSPAHSKRKPKRSPHKTADLSNNVDANDAQVAQTSPILEGEEDGITRTQLAALIAELGAENSLRREDVDRDTFGTAWTRLAGTEFERSLTGNDSSSEILLQPADSFADTGSDFRIRKDAPPAFRSTTISVRLSESEFSLVRQRASAAGVSPAAYLRVCVLVEREPRAEINEALAAMRHAAIELQAAGSRKSLDWNLRQPPYKTPWFQKIRRFFHARSKPVPTPDSKHSPIWRTNLGKIRSL